MRARPDALAGPAPRPQLTCEQRVAVALTQFEAGFHCSQSVLEAYVDDFGLDPIAMRKMGAAIAGGSTAGGECGAVASGYLILGLRHGTGQPTACQPGFEQALVSRLRQFVAEFRRRNGAITCRELLGIDVFDRVQWEAGQRRRIFATRCPGFIRDAITILEELG
jgi:C_GCAxxG_C_C family probable redox protein